MPFVGAIEFTINSPSETVRGEEFEVRIESSEEQVHDVKIYLAERNGRDSEIYDGSEWKNSYYYLLDAFPSQTVYRLRTANFSGNSEICARLRVPDGATSEPVCLPIIVNEASEHDESNDDEENENSNNNEEESQEESDQEEEVEEDNDETRETNRVETPSPEILVNNAPKKREKIVLKSPSLSQEPSLTYISAEQRLRERIIYAFAGFCALLVILLALKKI